MVPHLLMLFSLEGTKEIRILMLEGIQREGISISIWRKTCQGKEENPRSEQVGLLARVLKKN